MRLVSWRVTISRVLWKQPRSVALYRALELSIVRISDLKRTVDPLEKETQIDTVVGSQARQLAVALGELAKHVAFATPAYHARRAVRVRKAPVKTFRERKKGLVISLCESARLGEKNTHSPTPLSLSNQVETVLRRRSPRRAGSRSFPETNSSRRRPSVLWKVSVFLSLSLSGISKWDFR